MRLVLGLHELASFAGTQSYTTTIAAELAALGHEVVIVTEAEGESAAVARERGLRVESSPARFPERCDATIAQDAVMAHALAARYPDSRRLMVAHSDFFALQSPPQLRGVVHAVVVLNDRVRRHVEALAAAPPVVRLHQPVDLKRFGARGAAPRPRRALLLGNYLRGTTLDAVEAACREAGFTPVVQGHQATPTAAPERAIADADVVVGLGRCVVEAMAGRRAAYVYGIAGGDGWVTPERHAALEADGFGGLAEERVIDPATLARELAQWTPAMGGANRQLAEAHHGAGPHAAALVDALRAIEPDDGWALAHADELARLVRAEWQSWARYVELLTENRELRAAVAAEVASNEEHLARIADLERRLTAAEADARERAGAYDALRATRRFRIAGLLGAPLDALRRRR